MKGIAARIGRAVAGFFRKVGLVRTVAVAAALAVLLTAGPLLVSLGILPAQAMQALPQEGLSPSTGEISQRQGEIVAAEADGIRMIVDTATLNIRLEHTETGAAFNTLSGNELLPGKARSPLTLSWRQENGQTGNWNAYDYAIARGQYTIDRIDNGVRLSMTLSPGESYVVSDYLPEKISAARYQEKFLDALDRLEAEGTAADKVANYRKMLKMFYRYDDTGDFYYVAYGSTPAKSIMLILIDLVRTVGYTQEDIRRDCEEFDIEVEFTNPVQFTVYLEHTLDNGSLSVRFPSYEILCDNADYTVESVALYPGFACADEAQNDGFLFVPDGAGMLIKMDSGSTAYGDYARSVYNSDWFNVLYKSPTYSEELTMPVFGQYHTGGEKVGSGYLSVIETGAEVAQIATTLKQMKGGEEGGNLYNAVYPVFYLVQSANVKVFGELSTNSATYRVSTDRVDADFRVRYWLFGEQAGYDTFADTYRNYLIDKYDLSLRYDDSARLFINLLGAASVEDSAMGIPYEKRLSLTSYAQATQIMDELSDVNAVYNYRWGLNGGRTAGYGGYAEPVTENGSRAELEALLARSREGAEVFFQTDLLRVARGGNWLQSGIHAVNGFNGDTLELSDTYYPDGTLNLEKPYSNYWLLHPTYLPAAIGDFVKNADWLKNVFAGDLGSVYYASYGGKYVSPMQAAEQVLYPALETLSEQKTLALSDPYGDRLVYSDYAVDISRESSDYGSSYTAVPFRQLVMNGITAYTTLNVNMATSSPQYFLLQAVELNAMPQFTLSAEGVEELIKAGISDYYSVKYSDLKMDLLAFYEQYKTAREQIGCGEITGHRMLGEKVFETTYANGVRVLVNYNLFETEAEGHSLAAQGFLIVEG